MMTMKTASIGFSRMKEPLVTSYGDGRPNCINRWGTWRCH